MFTTNCIVIFVSLALFLAGSAVAIVEGIASSRGGEERKLWTWKFLVAALFLATYFLLFCLVCFFYFYVFIDKNNIAPIDVSAAVYATFSVELLRLIIVSQRRLLSSIAIKIVCVTCALASGAMVLLRSLGGSLTCFSFVAKDDEDNAETAGAQPTSSSSSPLSSTAPSKGTDRGGARLRSLTECSGRNKEAEAEAEGRKANPTGQQNQNRNPNPNSNPSQGRKRKPPVAQANPSERTVTPPSNCAHGSANVHRTPSGARISVRDSILQMGEEQLLKLFNRLVRQGHATSSSESVPSHALRGAVESGLLRRDNVLKAKAKEERRACAARAARETREARAVSARAARESRETQVRAARQAREETAGVQTRNALAAHQDREDRAARARQAAREKREARAAAREARAAAARAFREARRAREAEEEQKKSNMEAWTLDHSIQLLLNQILQRSPSHPGFIDTRSSFAEVSKSYKQALLLIHPDKHTAEDQHWATELFRVVSGKFAEYKEQLEGSSSHGRAQDSIEG